VNITEHLGVFNVPTDRRRSCVKRKLYLWGGLFAPAAVDAAEQLSKACEAAMILKVFKVHAIRFELPKCREL
jgi:hypothetical protein